MAIILNDVRLFNDVFKYEVMKCDSGINGLVNISPTRKVPFVTLEFYDSETRQKAIRRYFMKRNASTGLYDQWDGKSPVQLKAMVGVKLPGVFETRNGYTIFFLKHEASNLDKIDAVFKKEAELEFDVSHNNSKPKVDIANATRIGVIDSESKNENLKSGNNIESAENDNKNPSPFMMIIMLVILIFVAIIIFAAMSGALNGVTNALSSIPSWLRIILFVSISLLIGGGFISSSGIRGDKNK